MGSLNTIRTGFARIVATGVLAGLLTIGLSACGGSDTPTPPAAVPTATTAAATGGSSDTATPTTGTSSSGGSGQANTATLNEWSVTLNPADVSAGNVTFTVNNDGQFTHDLVILDSSGTKVAGTDKFAKAQGPQTLQADLKPGTYTFLCDIPGHSQKGMKTEVTVK